MKGWIIIVGLFVKLLACSDTAAPPAVESPGKKALVVPAAQTGDPSSGEAKTQTKYSYSPVGKRDPFRSYLADLSELDAKKSHKKITDTEVYELDQYRLTGLITGTSQPQAMVEDPTGKGHSVKIGARIGKRGGVVTRITDSGIVVTEEMYSADGKLSRIPYLIKLPKPETELLEHP